MLLSFNLQSCNSLVRIEFNSSWSFVAQFGFISVTTVLVGQGKTMAHATINWFIRTTGNPCNVVIAVLVVADRTVDQVLINLGWLVVTA